MLGERGIRPEQLPASEDIKKLERRVKSQEKKIAEQSLVFVSYLAWCVRQIMPYRLWNGFCQIRTILELIMMNELPKVKLDLRGVREYAKSRGIAIQMSYSAHVP